MPSFRPSSSAKARVSASSNSSVQSLTFCSREVNLESIARVEAQAYAALADLGAPAPSSVVTVGGGARSAVWTAIRARVLGLPVTAAAEVEGSVGLARWIARMR